LVFTDAREHDVLRPEEAKDEVEEGLIAYRVKLSIRLLESE